MIAAALHQGGAERALWVSLKLNRFTDLQSLLLDPIHDVDESGWPQTAIMASLAEHFARAAARAASNASAFAWAAITSRCAWVRPSRAKCSATPRGRPRGASESDRRTYDGIIPFPWPSKVGWGNVTRRARSGLRATYRADDRLDDPGRRAGRRLGVDEGRDRHDRAAALALRGLLRAAWHGGYPRRGHGARSCGGGLLLGGRGQAGRRHPCCASRRGSTSVGDDYLLVLVGSGTRTARSYRDQFRCATARVSKQAEGVDAGDKAIVFICIPQMAAQLSQGLEMHHVVLPDRDQGTTAVQSRVWPRCVGSRRAPCSRTAMRRSARSCCSPSSLRVSRVTASGWASVRSPRSSRAWWVVRPRRPSEGG